MRKLLGILTLVALAGAACYIFVPYDDSRTPPRRSRPSEPARGYYDRMDVSYFYEYLQPYGLWVSYSPYGYVWVPRDVGYRWRPYSRGRWAWTDHGWTWVSVERWGWIAFHYGRWGWDRRMGWFWVPDIVWGPAWVGWRWGGGHIGWAPLPPGADFHPGRGFGRRDWNIPYQYWVFVRGRDFMDRSLDRWVLPYERNTTIINLTVVNINISTRDNRVFNEGVGLDHVRRETNTPVTKTALKDGRRPEDVRSSVQEVVVYRPEVSRNELARPKQAIEQEQAAERLDAERAGRYFRDTPAQDSVVLRRVHEQEQKLMEESQEVEINEIRRRAAEEIKTVQNPETRKKTEEQVNSRIGELRKKHVDEKTELAKRQKEEEEKTKKRPTPVRKKDGL